MTKSVAECLNLCSESGACRRTESVADGFLCVLCVLCGEKKRVLPLGVPWQRQKRSEGPGSNEGLRGLNQATKHFNYSGIHFGKPETFFSKIFK